MLTPVKAVPEKAHAKGSRYQGAMAMKYRLAAMATTDVATAPQALTGLILKTCVLAEGVRPGCIGGSSQLVSSQVEKATHILGQRADDVSQCHAIWQLCTNCPVSCFLCNLGSPRCISGAV